MSQFPLLGGGFLALVEVVSVGEIRNAVQDVIAFFELKFHFE
jgi:hypothetical protein